MRSLLRSSSLPRCLSAGRSPSTEQALVLLEDDDSKYRKDRSSPRTKVTEYSDGKEVEPHDFKKKHGSTTTTSTSMASARQPFHFSNDNLTRNMIKVFHCFVLVSSANALVVDGLVEIRRRQNVFALVRDDTVEKNVAQVAISGSSADI